MTKHFFFFATLILFISNSGHLCRPGRTWQSRSDTVGLQKFTAPKNKKNIFWWNTEKQSLGKYRECKISGETTLKTTTSHTINAYECLLVRRSIRQRLLLSYCLAPLIFPMFRVAMMSSDSFLIQSSALLLHAQCTHQRSNSDDQSDRTSAWCATRPRSRRIMRFCVWMWRNVSRE